MNGQTIEFNTADHVLMVENLEFKAPVLSNRFCEKCWIKINQPNEAFIVRLMADSGFQVGLSKYSMTLTTARVFTWVL